MAVRKLPGELPNGRVCEHKGAKHPENPPPPLFDRLPRSSFLFSGIPNLTRLKIRSTRASEFANIIVMFAID